MTGFSLPVYIEASEIDKTIKDVYAKDTVAAPDGEVVFEYFCAYPQFVSGDTSKNDYYKSVAESFVNDTKSASQKALDDYQTSKENGFMFIPHKMELTFEVKDRVEFVKETFDGMKREKEIIK